MSDIHGNYQKFLSILEQISFGENDVLYIDICTSYTIYVALYTAHVWLAS